VNALLSFVYTLLTNEVQNALKIAGLDPYLGALHAPGRGRPSLACDLVEEWRAWGERMVLTLINRKVMVPEDFVYRKPVKSGDRPVEMKPAVSRALIGAYEKQMEHRVYYPAQDEVTTLRMIVHGQARRFATSLEDDAEVYEPFLLPH
jgi:CRISPR-associated protein Cas1